MQEALRLSPSIEQTEEESRTLYLCAKGPCGSFVEEQSILHISIVDSLHQFDPERAFPKLDGGIS